MNEEELLALVGLLNYSWYEEYVDYLCCVDRSNHVYNRIAVLLGLLYKVDETVLSKETLKIVNGLKSDIATIMIRDSVEEYSLN